jgi:hypothetical protein
VLLKLPHRIVRGAQRDAVGHEQNRARAKAVEEVAAGLRQRAIGPPTGEDRRVETLLMEREIRDRLAGKAQLAVNVMYLSAIECGDWTTVSTIERAPTSFPGLIMELPRYHRPRLNAVAQKTWVRLGAFVAGARPRRSR